MQRVIKFLRENRFLLLILLLASILRFYGISRTPPSLNWDEVSHGYNAYSILKTGQDEWGVSWPGIFRAYGDYKLPVYIYATATSEFFFGLTPFAVRLPSVLAGVALVLFTYLLTKKLFETKWVASFATLLVAIEPWSFFLSRGAFEANFSQALIVAGVYFFPHPLSAILLGLSVWTYNSARIFVPLLLLLLVLLYKKEIWVDSLRNRGVSRRTLGVSAILLALFLIPMFWQLANPAGQARYGWVSIIDDGAIAQIHEARAKANYSPLVERALYNKLTYFAPRFAQNYFAHFFSEFMFLRGGSNFQFNVPNHGLIYFVNLPLFLMGLIYLIKKRGKSSWLVLGWLLLAPIPSSLTREAPHTLRAITMLPIPMVVTALGGITVWRWWSEKIRSTKHEIRNALRVIPALSYPFLLATISVVYMVNYFTEYRGNYSWSWQYGYTWAVDYAKANYDEYDRIIVTKKYGEPHEFFLFYWPWDPEKYRSDPNLIRFHQSDWYWVDRFDKFYFVNDWQVPKMEGGSASWRMESGGEIPIEGRTLLITTPDNYPPGWEKLKTIFFLDGQKAFEILEHEE